MENDLLTSTDNYPVVKPVYDKQTIITRKARLPLWSIFRQ